MVDSNDGFRACFLVLYFLCFGQYLFDLTVLGRLSRLHVRWLDELVLSKSAHIEVCNKPCSAYVSKYYTALLVNVGLIVIVNAKFREQYFVLVFGKRALFQSADRPSLCPTKTDSQPLLCFRRTQASFLYQSPEGCVIQIIYVACSVSAIGNS